MGLFYFFKKKKTVSRETINNFIETILAKYFESSKTKLLADANELIKLTQFNLLSDEMVALLLRGLGILELKGDWNIEVANAMHKECSGKLSDVDLKWLLVYCDLHYRHKNPAMEALLLFELVGRQAGLPSPSGNITSKYRFHR